MTFEAASGPAPAFGFHGGTNLDAAAALLPEAAAQRLIAFGQRVSDAHSSTPSFEQVHELAEQKMRHIARIKQLELPNTEGGFGLPELASQIVSERRALERVERELARLRELKEVRSARWTTQVQLQGKVIDWITAGGVPTNCSMVNVDDLPEAELLKKGESVVDGIERYRHRLRELAADAHRIRSAPYPSAEAKAKLRQHIAQLAEAGVPNVDSMIEHGSPLTFATTMLQTVVRGTDALALAITEQPDTLSLLAFLFKDEMIKRIEAEIDEVADDEAALSERDRAVKLADIAVQELAIERMEIACIRLGEARGELLDYRDSTSPLALLGVRLITAPYREPDYNGHAWDVAMPRR